MAAEAEAAGWDGVFTFDAVAIDGLDLDDPWIVLAAMALRTRRVTLGAMVFAPARRRPWLFAKEASTLDRLSGGRLVLPVGLGALDDRCARYRETVSEIDLVEDDWEPPLDVQDWGRPWALEPRVEQSCRHSNQVL